MQTTSVMGQMENTFVDDFVITEGNDLIVYHQCKDDKSLSWNVNAENKIASDFRKQEKYSNEWGETFSLVLVHTGRSERLNKQKVPDDLKNTRTEMFPNYGNVSSMVQQSGSFRSLLGKIIGPDASDFDKGVEFGCRIKSIWTENDGMNLPIPLQTFKDGLTSAQTSFVFIEDLVALPESLSKLCEKFPPLKIVLTKEGVLTFEYSGMKGQAVWDPDMEAELPEVGSESELIQFFLNHPKR